MISYQNFKNKCKSLIVRIICSKDLRCEPYNFMKKPTFYFSFNMIHLTPMNLYWLFFFHKKK